MLTQVMLCYMPNVPQVLLRSRVHCALPLRLALVGKQDGETMAGSERVEGERMVVDVTGALLFSAGHYLGVEWKT